MANMQVSWGRTFRGAAPIPCPCWIGAGFPDQSSPVVAPGYPYRAGLALAVSRGYARKRLGGVGVGGDGSGRVGRICSRRPGHGGALTASVAVPQAAAGDRPASVNAPYAVRPAAPGVWQPTPPAYAPATQYGNRLAKPFALARQSQFRLGPPLALDSARYAADFAEVRGYGALDSTARSTHQTETATFWLGPSLTLYTEPLRVALSRTDQASPGRRSWSHSFTWRWWTPRSRRPTASTPTSGGVPSRRSDPGPTGADSTVSAAPE